MAELIISPTVDAIHRGIVQAIKRVIRFESNLEDLRATIESVTPKINRIAQLKVSNKFLEDEICKLMLLLSQAEEHINRCSRVAWWNCYKKYRYSKKLLELDDSLSRSLMKLPLLIWEYTAQILDEIIKLNEKLARIVHERNAYGRILDRSKAKVLILANGLKKIVQSVPFWINPYLKWFVGLNRSNRGYQTITASFCSNYGKGE